MTATAPAAPAKVYFTNLRTHARESQLDKLKRLIRRAGIEQIDFQNKFVAIKIHFGELGNLSFLRPNYARAVADVVKELGGKPFLTDCNTLYVVAAKTRSSTSTPPTRTLYSVRHGLPGHHRRRPQGYRRGTRPGRGRRVRARGQDRPGTHGCRHRDQPHAL